MWHIHRFKHSIELCMWWQSWRSLPLLIVNVHMKPIGCCEEYFACIYCELKWWRITVFTSDSFFSFDGIGEYKEPKWFDFNWKCLPKCCQDWRTIRMQVLGTIRTILVHVIQNFVHLCVLAVCGFCITSLYRKICFIVNYKTRNLMFSNNTFYIEH